MWTSIAAYQFIVIESPDLLARELAASARRESLLGTVLVAGEGLNVCLTGRAEGIACFVRALRSDARFATIHVKTSVSATAPFARLKIKIKDEIIRFGRDDASPLPGRAPSVSPTTLARWIARGVDDDGRRLVLLDTRNREEVAHGGFVDALSLPIDSFTELPDALAPHRAALADTTVVSYCTGGIRCEKAAAWMRASGMDNVLQLDGGILDYFAQVGDAGYRGDCFVFDERIALDPQLRALSDRDAELDPVVTPTSTTPALPERTAA